MGGMYSLQDLLSLVARQGADELRLEPGRPPVMMLHGKARVMDGALVTSDNIAVLFRSIATEEQNRELARCGESHFIFAGEHSARFKVTAAMSGEHLNLIVKNLDR